MKRIRISQLTVFWSVLTVIPVTSGAVDLLGSYEQALMTDPSMLAAQEAILAGREKRVQGSALLKPQLNITASYTHVHDESQVDLPPIFSSTTSSESAGNLRSYTAQLTQPLYDSRAFAENKQLHQQTEQSEVDFRNASQDLIRRVVQTYFNVLLAQETLRVTETQKAAVKEQLDRAQARYEAGREKITDVYEAQARYDAVLADEISAQSSLAVRQSQYREVTGEPAVGLVPLRADFKPTSPDPDNLAIWESKALKGNLQVMIRRNQIDIAEAEINKYRLIDRPTLDLVASYNKKGQSGGLSPFISPNSDRMWTVGVQFNQPLYSGGKLNSKLRESIAKHGQTVQELAAAQRDARLQVQDAYLTVRTGVAKIKALEQSLLSGQTSLEAITLGRDIGTRTTLDVLEAEQRVFKTQLDLAQARYNYMLGRVQLTAVVGELQEDDLRILNSFLLN
jgi:outer membrane protein